MKKQILTVIAVLGFAGLASASTVCGELSKRAISPKCAVGAAGCSHMMRIENLIEKTDGSLVIVDTESSSVLEQLGALQGKTVCATGSLQKIDGDTILNATSVVEAKSADEMVKPMIEHEIKEVIFGKVL